MEVTAGGYLQLKTGSCVDGPGEVADGKCPVTRINDEPAA
jgi:hypothetical protein